MEEKLKFYTDLYAQQASNSLGHDHAFIKTFRDEAYKRFVGTGFPHRKLEDWKYTPLTSLNDKTFTVSEKPVISDATSLLQKSTLSMMHGHVLVFVNGHFYEDLSTTKALPKGAILTSLSQALIDHPNQIKAYLKTQNTEDESGVRALNGAFMTDGVFLALEKNSVLEDPVQLVFLHDASTDTTMSHYRHILSVGENAKLDLVEYYIGTDQGAHFTNAVTDCSMGEGANVNHYKIQNECQSSTHLAYFGVDQAKDSALNSFVFTRGAKLSRQDIQVALNGKGASCDLQGLYTVTEKQHTDTHTRIDHNTPNGTSRELYKGIMDGQAKAVFNGKVIVHPDAQNTLSSQTNKNLLLSSSAEIDTKPELEIYADDVKCTHGATVGELDKNMLFYLRSRGICEEEARALLIKAFANDILKKIELVYLQNHLTALVDANLTEQGLTP